MTPDTLELAWAAGFFDGEGGTYGDPKGGFRIRIGQLASNREVLDRFHNAVGGLGKIRGPYSNGKGRPMMEWTASSWPIVQAVVALLWNHLGTDKRTQAKTILSRIPETGRGWSNRMTYRKPQGGGLDQG